MISPVSNLNLKKLSFGSDKENDNGSVYKDDTLLENNFQTRARIGLDKFTKAFSVYPAKGLAGSKNSNFYEFLTMGTVPYVIGSITLMSIFNSANKHFGEFAKSKASKAGKKMALGVLFYGVFKELSKNLVNLPIKWKTGIDTELPYAKVNYLLQEIPGDFHNLTSIEYHKIGESVDFPRWDLLYGDLSKDGSVNFRYDAIAKKNGLGENLNDSDQEVKPIYKEVLVKSKLAKSFSSFLWAATGVALAFQKPWENWFRVATFKFWNVKDFIHSSKVFGQSFVQSAKSLWSGEPGAGSKFEKHSGKALIGVALAVTIAGVLNALKITRKPSEVTGEDVLDKNKECVVS